MGSSHFQALGQSSRFLFFSLRLALGRSLGLAQSDRALIRFPDAAPWIHPDWFTGRIDSTPDAIPFLVSGEGAGSGGGVAPAPT
jgi:hypothetical protein